MRMVDLIIKKRDGQELSDKEIRFWVRNYVSGSIPDYQTSAMLMAILFRGMNDREVDRLTKIMEHSGETLDLSSINGIKVDKHSTGGVGDKTTLVLGPMVAACGVKMAKLSGRGLGHTGGTLDKLESIPGFSVSVEGQKFIDQVNEIGLAVAGQTKSLVPADKKMYALRDVTGTVESIPLIAASVMSKKLAAGSDVICLDVTVGDGAFMKNMDQARELARIMVGIGNRLGRKTSAVISDMSQPLGYAIGNALEVKEAISALHGEGPEDLMELCYTAGSILLQDAGAAKNEKEARRMLRESITSGKAFAKFLAMVKAQGGDPEYILHPEKFEEAANRYRIRAPKSGYVQAVNALELGLSSMRLGGGRSTMDDVIDMSAGILLSVKVGDYVNEGDPLCMIYTNKSNVDEIIDDIRGQFLIGEKKAEKLPVIREIIREKR